MGIRQLKPEQKEAISRGLPCTRKYQCFTRAPIHGSCFYFNAHQTCQLLHASWMRYSVTLLTMQTLSIFLVGGAGVQDQQNMGPKS